MFKNYILNLPPIEHRTIDRTGKSLRLKPEGFMQMFTGNGLDRRFSNPWLVNACSEKLAQYVNGGEVVIESIFVERSTIQRIDNENKQLIKVSDEELLASSPNELVASRAIVKIEVLGLNDNYRPAIAINLNEDGEEIAFGGTVSICDNFTILSADRRLSTFKRHRDRTLQRLTTDELLEQIGQLFPRTEQILEGDLQLIEELKLQQVSRDQWYGFIGGLFSQIHYVNRMRLARQIATVSAEIKELPLTANLLAEIAAEGFAPIYKEYEWDGDMTNKWNVLNFGTEKTKVIHGLSPKAVLETNANWTGLVLNHQFSQN